MDQFTSHPLYRKHDIDSVMSSLWSFYKKYFVTLFVVSFIMSLAVQYIASAIDIQALQAYSEDPGKLYDKLKEFIGPMIIVSLINLLFSTILQYYVLYRPIDQEAGIITSLYRSARFFIPFLIIMILFAFAGSFAIVLGLFALIIGVFFAILYLMTIYLFILPVLIIEGPDIGTTIKRSFTLAHKGFWTNVGWTAIIAMMIILISVIFSSIILLPFTGNFLDIISNPEEASGMTDFSKSPVYIVLSAVVNALYFPVLPIFGAILYFNAKAREENEFMEISENDEPEKISIEDLYAKPREEKTPED